MARIYRKSSPIFVQSGFTFDVSILDRLTERGAEDVGEGKDDRADDEADDSSNGIYDTHSDGPDESHNLPCVVTDIDPVTASVGENTDEVEGVMLVEVFHDADECGDDL